MIPSTYKIIKNRSIKNNVEEESERDGRRPSPDDLSTLNLRSHVAIIPKRSEEICVDIELNVVFGDSNMDVMKEGSDEGVKRAGYGM